MLMHVFYIVGTLAVGGFLGWRFTKTNMEDKIRVAALAVKSDVTKVVK